MTPSFANDYFVHLYLSLVIAMAMKSLKMRWYHLVLVVLVLLSSVKMTFGTELKSSLLKVGFIINYVAS